MQHELLHADTQELSNSESLWTSSFISITLCSFLLFLNLQMLLSSFPAYVKNAFHAGDLQVSLVTSVFALSAIATRFTTAAVERKVPRNILLFIGLMIAAISTFIYPLANSVEALLIMRAGYGIGFGVVSTILPTIVSLIIPSKRMGEGIGYYGLSSSLAMSIGPMIGLNMMWKYGFRSLALLGTLTITMIIPILLGSRRLSSMQGRKAGKGIQNAKVSAFNYKLLFPAMLNVLLSITYSGVLSFIALYGQIVHIEQVGLFFLFNAVSIVLVRPVSGRLFDRRGHAAVLIPAALSVVASMAVLSYTTTLPMLIISALLYGLGFGAIQPCIQAWMLKLSTPEQYGAANSMFYNSTDLGVAVGAVILGAISMMSSYAAMYRYSAAFMLLFLVLYIVIRLFQAKK